jgi:tetratricopeptide (TPR) repeat protein
MSPTIASLSSVTPFRIPTPVPEVERPFPAAYSPPQVDMATFYTDVGERYYQQNRFREAIGAYNVALSLNNQDYQTYNKRGVAKAGIGIKDYAGAIADYTMALLIKPDFYNAYVNRGNLWVHVGNFQKALQDYTQAIRINPINRVAYENRGELYSTMGRHDLAVQDKGLVIALQKLRKAPAYNPNSAYYVPYRVALVLANDDYNGTENDLNGGPIQDATGIANVLRSQGFEVISGANLSGPQTKAKVDEFINKLKANPGAMSMTYYSGHGGSINGNNYLIPIDYNGVADANFENNAVSVDYLLKQLKQTDTYLNMIVLDACRTPLADGVAFKSIRGSGSLPMIKQWETEPGPGLANTWIEYASRPERPALQDGNQGLYTKYLKSYLQRPDLNLEDVAMYTSYALERDPVANREDQHARTQTDLSRTEPKAESFYFARPTQPVPRISLPLDSTLQPSPAHP